LNGCGAFQRCVLSTVVFGPGWTSRANAPDDYIEISELSQGIKLLTNRRSAFEIMGFNKIPSQANLVQNQ